MARKPVEFHLNGAEKAVFVTDGQNLLDVLRRGVGDLTPKFGCGQGTCGTCTVLIDGEPRLSCITLAETVAGRSIETADGMKAGADLHPLQTAFMEHFAAQCGFCTPGMLTTLIEFLRDNPDPTEREVRVAISGNLCRCTGYQGIVLAALDAAKRTKAAKA
jgi:carbon-monoxide dehydrogenase small subunit